MFFSGKGTVGRLGTGCNGIDSGLLDVVCRACAGTFFTGMGASSSTPLALSDVPQQFRNPRNPPDILGFCIGADCVVVALALPAFACVAPGEVPDLLLLATLPLRRRSIMLPFESFDRLPMLSVGSLAVAPLRPVDVGEGSIFWEDDLEGT